MTADGGQGALLRFSPDLAESKCIAFRREEFRPQVCRIDIRHRSEGPFEDRGRC